MFILVRKKRFTKKRFHLDNYRALDFYVYTHTHTLLMGLWGGQKTSSVLLYHFLPHLLELKGGVSLTEPRAGQQSTVPSDPPVSVLHTVGVTGTHSHTSIFFLSR